MITAIPSGPDLDTLVDAYTQEWLTRAQSTQMLDFAAVEDAVFELYTAFGKPCPKIVYCQSPLELYLTAQVLMLNDEGLNRFHATKSSLDRNCDAALIANLERIVTSRSKQNGGPGNTLRTATPDLWIRGYYVVGMPPYIVDTEIRGPIEVLHKVVAKFGRQLNNHVRNYRYGLARALPPTMSLSLKGAWEETHESESIFFMEFGLWASDYLLCTDLLRRLTNRGHESDEIKSMLDAHIKAARAAHLYAAFDNVCLVSMRPTSIALDDQGHLHCADGPALTFGDGFGVYSWHGVTIPASFVKAPELITVREINQQNNVTLRRIMLEIYGSERYIEDSFRHPMHEDEYGSLFRRRVDGSEDLVMVRVINSTPEPDGTSGEYWLRVPPHVLTAKEAVAWTFRLAPHEYNPIKET
ncbi:MAG: hypothetical protein SGJ27_13125 [Candidatus Melainabacteria bacterium]|nr:hypothetical protein [Candidatus Melainabacteria bacterium]